MKCNAAFSLAITACAVSLCRSEDIELDLELFEEYVYCERLPLHRLQGNNSFYQS